MGCVPEFGDESFHSDIAKGKMRTALHTHTHRNQVVYTAIDHLIPSPQYIYSAPPVDLWSSMAAL